VRSTAATGADRSATCDSAVAAVASYCRSLHLDQANLALLAASAAAESRLGAALHTLVPLLAAATSSSAVTATHHVYVSGIGA